MKDDQARRRQVFAEYLVEVERRMLLYLGRIGKFSTADRCLLRMVDDLAELRRLFEYETLD